MATVPYLRMLVLLCLLATTGCATLDKPDGYLYKVDVNGAGWGMKKTIKESTETCRFVGQPPSTVGQLRNRMEKDRERIEAILQSNGYYDGSVGLYLDTKREPAVVTINVWRGSRYRYDHVRLQFKDEANGALSRIKPRIRHHQQVIASAVFEEEKRILEEIKRRGYPFPRLLRRTVDVDREHKQVDLNWVFDPGEAATFGEVRVEGLTDLNDSYVRRQVPWDEGDKYNAKSVDDFERKLLTSGLFSSVRISLQPPPDDGNVIPVEIRLNERSKRSIRLGVNYSDVGPGVKGFWEHRSLFGGGEKLETGVSWDPVKSSGTGRFTRSGFMDARQDLVLELDATQDHPDAYDARKVTGTAMVLRDLTSRIQAGTGVGYKYSRVEQSIEDQHFSHVFFPLQAIYDSRNDRLNPVRGMQMYGRTSFFDDTLGSQSFLKTRLESRFYAMLWERYRLSSALRMTLGSIDVASIDAVPADERFYAGGGGSIRGYEYQEIGPQVNNVPVGGDKLVEFSAELRMQPGRRLGYAAFVDGGTVYNDNLDGYDRSLRYGAGVGIRWFTTIGPLRVDVAYPLNPTVEQIERVQFYISLGQAF